jgi:hypothetical protein
MNNVDCLVVIESSFCLISFQFVFHLLLKLSFYISLSVTSSKVQSLLKHFRNKNAMNPLECLLWVLFNTKYNSSIIKEHLKQVKMTKFDKKK